MLFRCYYARLYRYAFTIVGNEDAAKDIISDVFVHLWNRMGQLDSSSMEHYLIICTRNGCLSYYKKLSYESRYASEYLQQFKETYSDYDDEQEKDSRVLKMIDCLQPPSKDMLIAYYIHGKKHKQIASEMGYSVETVKKYIMNARNELRRIFKYRNND